MKKIIRTLLSAPKILKVLCFGILLFFGTNTAYGQVQSVSGTVTDANGVPLPGASILEKGTLNGTTSDFDGNYTITLNTSSAVLIYSYIGYFSQEKSAGSGRMDISLEEDAESLDEVVVIGYGTQNKDDISGSVSSVKSEDIADLKVATIDQALAGQAPGVVVSQTSGTPGGGVSVQVRGTVSINSSASPLYVVDGFPITSNNNNVSSNPLSNFSPNDIESIEILKDASAAAIYGSRAANGVILITTKKGKSGKPKFTFDYFSGFQQVERIIDVANAEQFAILHNESRNNGYIDDFGGLATDTNEQRQANGANGGVYLLQPQFSNPASLGAGTNWQDEIFRTAPITSAQLSVSGGNEKTKFYLSGGYFDQDGIIINSGFERFNIASNITTEVSDRVRIGANINLAYSVSDLVPSEGAWQSGGVINSALIMSPTVPVRDENGVFIRSLGDALPTAGLVGTVFNPVQIATETDWTRKAFRGLSTLYAEFDVLNDLTFKVLGGAEYEAVVSDRFSASTIPTNIGGNTRQRSTANRLNYLSELTLNYKKVFGEHNLNVLAGYSFQKNESLGTTFRSNNAPNDFTSDPGVGVFLDYDSNPSEWGLISYFGRIQYNYGRKYYVEGSVRRDGSSRFGSTNRYGTFPSASVAWRIGQENFLRESEKINELKIKASYGLTGNNGIGDFASQGRLGARNAIFDGGLQQGLVRNSFANEQLGWETTAQFNIGLEIGLFKNRLNILADYYDKRTRDLLLNLPISDITGSTSITSNIGEVSNKGWELSINSINVQKPNFEWSTNFNISANRNNVEELGGNGDPIFLNAPNGNQAFIIEEGSPIGSFYGLVFDGIYLDQADLDAAPDQAPVGRRPPTIGDVRLADLNNDGVVDFQNDRRIVGNTQADFVYGITNTFKYKNLDLSILIQGSEGNQVYNSLRRAIGNQVVFGNVYTEAFSGYRSPENPGNGVLPKVKRALTSETIDPSSFYVEDASFLRIRNITAGYTFPRNIVESISLDSLRLYASVQNAFLFTDYINYNPEVSSGRGPLNPGNSNGSPGIDNGSYPTPRTITIGLNVAF